MSGNTEKLGSINHLRLTVADIPRALGFYDPIMGFMGYRLVEQSANRLAWARFAAHGNLDWFILSLASPAHRATRHERFAPGFHHLAWNAESRTQVDDLHRLLITLGVTVLNPPAEYDYEPGYYAVFFSDPDGLKLELVHVPAISSRGYWAAFEARQAPLVTPDDPV